ncbi:hypothetical protein ACZ90_63525 [Streptomyces albus subsp. albus]|nr:hypothetical protein ACZ90_63525 [Streptomyces albus subsp. albus]
MSRADRARWRSARSLTDLGHLTAAWWEGTVRSLPGYPARPGPAFDLAPHTAVIAGVNRAGFFTRTAHRAAQATRANAAAVSYAASRADHLVHAVLLQDQPSDYVLSALCGTDLDTRPPPTRPDPAWRLFVPPQPPFGVGAVRRTGQPGLDHPADKDPSHVARAPQRATFAALLGLTRAASAIGDFWVNTAKAVSTLVGVSLPQGS